MSRSRTLARMVNQNFYDFRPIPTLDKIANEIDNIDEELRQHGRLPEL